MRTRFHILTAVALLAAWSGQLQAQGNATKYPIVLTQKLPNDVKTIVVGDQFDIRVVHDTANFVAVVTYGTVAEADTMRFPDGKLRLDNNGTRLTLRNGFPYRTDIQVHTATRSLTVYAGGDSKVTLTGNGTISFDSLSLIAKSNAIICVTDTVAANEVLLDVINFGEIRYPDIKAGKLHKKQYGSGRLMKNGERAEQGTMAMLIDARSETHIFLDWSLGISTLNTTPFGSFNSPTSNFIWSNTPTFRSSISNALRYAFWQKDHWSLSAGFGWAIQTYSADNAYLELVTDASGNSSLQAIDPTAITPASEGNVMWSSHFSSSQIYIPIRLEWRIRSNYKGIRLGAELRPGIAFARKNIYLYRNGYFEGKNKVAATHNKELGRHINQLNLGLRLTASYSHVSIFAESFLTPLFRTETEHPESKPALDQKLYPMTIGICFTL